MSALPEILLDLDSWDRASVGERLVAARAAAEGLPAGFEFDRLAAHVLGGLSHEIAYFRFEDALFALLPGSGSAELGYDRSHPFTPTVQQAADWKFTEEEYGVTLQQYLDHYLSPGRGVHIAPFLIEVATRRIDYGESGSNTSEGYQNVMNACGLGFRLPTADEWEYACAGGNRSLFRWGNETPTNDSYVEKEWNLHKQPNAFGLVMNSSTYDSEICQGPRFRGGDGGSSVCGGMGVLASWLPFASSFQITDEEVEGWYLDEVWLRRVRSIELQPT